MPAHHNNAEKVKCSQMSQQRPLSSVHSSSQQTNIMVLRSTNTSKNMACQMKHFQNSLESCDKLKIMKIYV